MAKYDYQKRIEQVCSRMRAREIDALMVTPGSDMKYLMGYEHPQDDKLLLLVIFRERDSFLICNRLHDVDREQAPVGRILEYAYQVLPMELLRREVGKREMPWKRAAISEGLPALFALELKEVWPGLQMVPVEELTAELRAVKDEQELEATREACRRADQALEICMSLGAYWLGKTEQQLEARMMYEMGNLGLRHNAVSVCFGKNAASPHHHPDRTVICPGKPLLIDFGADFDFYNTDMTRMFFFGEPDDRYRRLYGIVLEAQERGIEASYPGNTLQAVDRTVRDFLTEQGYGEFYIHRTSHGVGLDCHDYPKIPVEGETVIEEGMIFSVEPGLYFPGEYGIRIEDQVMIRGGKREILHSFPKNLQVIV